MGQPVFIILDLQAGIVARFNGAPDSEGYLPRVSKALAAARAADLPIIHVTTSFRPSYPEVSSTNLMFTPIKSSGLFLDGDASVQIVPEVAPLDSELRVTKRRVSAFTGSDLEVVLRGIGATELVLTGVATSGAVLSTLRQAADMDFGVTVVSDLCLDADAEVHRVLCEKVFTRQAKVVTAEEWAQAIGQSK